MLHSIALEQSIEGHFLDAITYWYMHYTLRYDVVSYYSTLIKIGLPLILTDTNITYNSFVYKIMCYKIYRVGGMNVKIV